MVLNRARQSASGPSSSQCNDGCDASKHGVCIWMCVRLNILFNYAKKIKSKYFCILDEPIFIVVYLGYFIVTNTVLHFDQHLHMFLEL
jgi:hypothetical protein